jgi:hypothetical protein
MARPKDRATRPSDSVWAARVNAPNQPFAHLGGPLEFTLRPREARTGGAGHDSWRDF